MKDLDSSKNLDVNSLINNTHLGSMPQGCSNPELTYSSKNQKVDNVPLINPSQKKNIDPKICKQVFI